MDLGRRVRGEVGEIGSDGVGEESELVELRIGGANTENLEIFFCSIRHFFYGNERES